MTNMLLGVVQVDKKNIFGICIILLFVIPFVQGKIYETGGIGIQKIYVEGTTDTSSFDCKNCISEGVQLNANYLDDSDVNCGTTDTLRQVGGSLECSNVTITSTTTEFGNSATDWEVLLYSSADASYGRFYWWGNKAALASGYINDAHSTFGSYSASIGYQVNAKGTGGVCIGDIPAYCGGDYSFGMSGSFVDGNYAVAFPDGTASATEAIAIGSCTSEVTNAICVGTGTASGVDSIVIGTGDASNDYSVSIGTSTEANNNYAHAFGTYCNVNAIWNFGFCGYGASLTTITEPYTFSIRKANFSVDSDVLFVDQENERVGINTPEPSTDLEVYGNLEIRETDDGNPSIKFIPSDSYSQIIFYNVGTPTVWFNSSNKTYIPRNSLGVGTNSPSADLDINGQLIIANANKTGDSVGSATNTLFSTGLKFTNSSGLSAMIAEELSTVGSTLYFIFINETLIFQNGDRDQIAGFSNNGYFFVAPSTASSPDYVDGVGDLWVSDEIETDDLYLTGSLYAKGPTIYLDSNTNLGDHNCDDTPSGCCDTGYHLCTISEFLEGGRRIEAGVGLEPNYNVLGDVDAVNDSVDVDCKGWSSADGSYDRMQCKYVYTGPSCAIQATSCANSDYAWCCSD